MPLPGTKTRLERKRLSKVYLQRLRRCRKHFDAWDHARGQPLTQLLSAPVALDAYLAQYFSAAQAAGVQCYVAKHAVLHLEYEHRHLRRQLPRGWDSIRAWEAAAGWKPRPPLTEALMLDVFLAGLDLGLARGGPSGYLYVACAVLLRVVFYALLRPGELLKAKVNGFCLQPQVHGPSVGVFVITDPKNKSHFGRTQFSVIRDAGATVWLQWILVGRVGEDRLWPSTGYSLRGIARAIFETCGLEVRNFNLSSCRPGGATHFFLQGTPVDHLQFWGRWKAPGTLRSYLQEGMS